MTSRLCQVVYFIGVHVSRKLVVISMISRTVATLNRLTLSDSPFSSCTLTTNVLAEKMILRVYSLMFDALS